MKRLLLSFVFILGLSVLGSTEALAYTSSYGVNGVGLQPNSITIDSLGNIYTANIANDNVSKRTPAGVVTLFGVTGDEPYDIAIDSFDNIYTANRLSNTVTKITPAGVSSVFGTTGSSPSEITIDSVGNVYTANNGDGTITKITPAGVSSTLGAYVFVSADITVDLAGNVYSANVNNDNVTKMTPAGVLSTLGTTGDEPVGITIDPAGNVYTADRANNTVTKITPAGVSTLFGGTGNGPGAIAIDSTGNVYTGNQYSQTVTKITPAGVSTTIGTAGNTPTGIIVDPAGSVYIANVFDNSITIITTPSLTEVTPVSTPSTDTTPSYTFAALTDLPNTITYGGSCSSTTTSATLGSNTITFNALPPGTYSNCTIMVTDAFGSSNTLNVSSFTITPLCTPTGTPETVCNGVDDDCDTLIDENFTPAACDGADTDLCAEGNSSCTAGVLACSDATGSTVESCNGVDDECNGTVDDGGSALCTDANSCTTDICSGVSGCGFPPIGGTHFECISLSCVAVANNPTTCTNDVGCTASGQVCGCVPTTEVCNGVDDDCNGLIDEGGNSLCTDANACSLDACTGTGGCANVPIPAPHLECVGSTCVLTANTLLVCTNQDGCLAAGDTCACTPTGSPENNCNGIDDDCDGSIDEDFLATSCATGVGYCLGTGATSCSGGVTSCSAVAGLPTVETCGDAIDQDCNGSDLACTCGDGIAQPGEQCDDGNMNNNDTCTNVCTLPICGDGFVQSGSGETCDDGNLISGDGCSFVCLIEVADPGITKTADNPNPSLNGIVNFFITVTNSGQIAATGIVVNDVLPPGLTLISASTTSGTVVLPSWSIATLAPAATETLTISARVATTNLATNIATLTSASPDPNSVNNTSQVSITPQVATVSGHIFWDDNRDGNQDISEEGGFANLSINITDSRGSFVVVTNASGDYVATVAPGMVNVAVDVNDTDLPDDYVITADAFSRTVNAIVNTNTVVHALGIDDKDKKSDKDDNKKKKKKSSSATANLQRTLARTGIPLGAGTALGFASLASILGLNIRPARRYASRGVDTLRAVKTQDDNLDHLKVL